MESRLCWTTLMLKGGALVRCWRPMWPRTGLIKIERAQTSAFMPGLSEPCSRCVQGADNASRHGAGNTAPALTNPNRGPGSNGYEHRTYCSARRQVVQGALVYLHDPHR